MKINTSYLLKQLLTYCCIFIFFGCSKESEPVCFQTEIDHLKLNEIQVITSHNSYRKITTPAIFNLLNSLVDLFPIDQSPLHDWDYDHVPIPEQLNTYNIRGLEIDIYRDPEGGKFFNRFGNILTSMPIESNENALKEPGLKVLHIPDVDYNTHHFTFLDALTTIKDWSDENPNHYPLFVFIEPKEESVGNYIPLPQFASALEFDAVGFETVENEIREVFTDVDQILKPADIRKDAISLKDAILTNGWPTVADCRGKIVFILIASDEQKNTYANEYASNMEKLLFAFGEKIEDETIFYALDNPLTHSERIKYLVNQGFIVRTRSDAGTLEARKGSFKRFSLGLQSGAQLISTDYYRPDPRHSSSKEWSDYSVNFGTEIIGMVNNEIGKRNEKGCLVKE